MSAPLVWGLTGGIASGKSTVARIFAKSGFPTVDADEIARTLRGPGGRANPAIVARFGTSDPAELRKIVFNDARARQDLEKIIHPLIKLESEKQIQDHAGSPFVLYEAALLVETKRYQDFTGLITVEAPMESRISRLMSRDQITRDDALKIINAQLSEQVRRKAATFVVENNDGLEGLEKHVKALIPSLYKSEGFT
jgi:dephospho-CoA kinase